MTFTKTALKNLKDFDLYVKIFVDVNDETEIAVANCSDDMVVCDNIWSEAELNKILEHWGEED